MATPGAVVGTNALITPGGAQGPGGAAGGTGPQGPQGNPGTPGAAGTNGLNAFNITSGSFTVPAVGSSVTVTLNDASWVVVGQFVYVDTAGGGAGLAGALQVTGKTGNQITLTNPVAPQPLQLANTTQSGLLAQVSGNVTDYVGGDNACHPIAASVRLGGYLKYVSATQLSFAPYNGNLICINGILYTIPNAGIAGLTNTNCYVNGVAGQSLASNTTYFVYCFNNAGVLTADFSTTGHATSTSGNNSGTEIKSGDDSRTLIGIIATSGTSFMDTTQNRFVRSWVNRRRVVFSAPGASGSMNNTSYVGIVGCNIVAFADDAIQMTSNGYAYNNTVGAITYLSNYLDGAALGLASLFSSVSATAYACLSATVATQVADGNHAVAVYMQVGAGTATYGVNIVGTVG